jgi:hypothetical protein
VLPSVTGLFSLAAVTTTGAAVRAAISVASEPVEPGAVLVFIT